MELTSAQRILVCVARRELTSDTQTELRQLVSNDLDWSSLCSTAEFHGLLPLLHKHLSAYARDLTPDEILNTLKGYSLANAQSVLHLLSKLLKVFSLFQQNGIRMAVFKGAVLAKVAYGDVGLRQAGDIDILIRRQDFAQAKEFLKTIGFQMSPELTDAQQTSHLNFHCEIQFMMDDWFSVVDLHWGLAPQSFVFGLNATEVMDRLESTSVNGVLIPTFCSEDLIIYQAMHGAKHLWQRLEWIASLAELVRSSTTLDWDTVIRRATNSHTKRIVALGLHLIDLVFEERVPERVLAALDPKERMRRFAEEVLQQIFLPRSSPESTESNLFNFRIMDRKRDALRSTLRAIFVPTLSDWQSVHLSSSLHPLYYAVRPLRLTGVYGNSLWRKLKGDTE